ncbi:hypothetical protein [Mucilaginibacter sp.]|uniref:hypothetical protein n=1 Tax=Mucilaginibacter sp. TaxID=1882438 RepID=UPI0035BC49A3
MPAEQVLCFCREERSTGYSSGGILKPLTIRIMIQATATPVGNFLLLEIVHPGQKELIRKRVTNESDGLRVIYLVNRGYMREKLLAWVKQRKHADKRITIQAAQLQALILYYNKNIPFKTLCKIVHAHRAFFEAIAPPVHSQFHKYYLNTIVPILNDAEEMAG